MVEAVFGDGCFEDFVFDVCPDAAFDHWHFGGADTGIGGWAVGEYLSAGEQNEKLMDVASSG